MTRIALKTTVAAASLAVVLGAGCASKKYVRASVAPVSERVTELESKTEKNSGEIAELGDRVERDVARLDERAASALREAAAAQSSANRAQHSADEASGQAGEVRTFAGTGLNRLETTMIDMAIFEPKATESILFDFDKAALSEEAKRQIGEMMSLVSPDRRFVVEVRGFTDSTGSAPHNLRLSESRAEAVVRELTTAHHTPLRAIHRVGLGDNSPLADNKTAEGRKQNRRVEVTLYLPRADAPARLSQN